MHHHHLAFLVADLYRDADLRASFREDPKSVLDRYKIPAEVRAVLWRRDQAEIKSILHQGVDSMVEQMAHGSPVFMPYFGIPPKISTVSPSSSATNIAVAFTLTGFFFDSKATLSFARPGILPIFATDVMVTLTDKETSATTLTGFAAFPVAGAYNVTVANPGTEEASTTVSGKFTVKN